MWLCKDKLKEKKAHFRLPSACQKTHVLKLPISCLFEQLSYDLEKVFTLCFTDQCLARLKQSFSSFPPRKLLIPNSRKFHGKMSLFVFAFAKPMKIRAPLFLFDKPINRFAFLFSFCFYVYFSTSYERCSKPIVLLRSR